MDLLPEQDLNEKNITPKVAVREETDYQSNLAMITWITGIVLLFVGFGFLTVVISSGGRVPNIGQYTVLAIAFIVSAIISIISGNRILTRHFETNVIVFSVTVQVCLIIFSALVSGIGLPTALIIFLLTNIITFSTLPHARTNFAINGWVLMGIAAIIVNYFSPFRQITIPVLNLYIPTILGILFMIYIALLVMVFVSTTLRLQIISAFIAVTLIPLILFAFIQTTYTRWSLQQQNIRDLKIAAIQSASVFDEFIKSNLDQINSQASLFFLQQYLEASPSARSSSIEEVMTISNLTALQNAHSQDFFDSYGVLDTNGDNIFDTNPLSKGENEKNQAYFTEPLKNQKPFTSPVIFGFNNTPYIVFSSPVVNDQNQVIGVLRLRYNAAILQQLAEKSAGMLGQDSSPILIDDNNFRLADTTNSTIVFKPISEISSNTQRLLNQSRRLPFDFSNFPAEQRYSSDIATTIQQYQSKPDFTYTSQADDPIPTVGYVVKLNTMPWYIVYQQRQEILTTTLANQNRLTVIIVTIIAGLVSFVAALLARFLSDPITELTITAEKVTSGELTATAQVATNDEIRILANAFNLMTTQVRNLINQLEERVRDRTRELAQQNENLSLQSQQLQTVSEVARGIASSRDIEILLSEVTQLISLRFGFYHVGIFLVDHQNEYAVLRAANSEGGQQMLAKQHKLKIGTTGMVGYVTGNGTPRIASDVGSDAVFFNNPDLPSTRSEMTLPLISENLVIGALDVQSTKENAFTEDDVKLFSILADQLTIAIVNNNLFDETKQALAETQELHRKYLRGEWNQEINRRKYTSFRYTTHGIEAQPAIVIPEMSNALQTGSVVVQSNSDSDQGNPSITIPVMLRGEPIGVIHVKDSSSQKRSWSQDDIGMVDSVADQIAQALENARLFEQTQRRAERERKVLEITSKIRSTTDIQTMLQIAVEELHNAFGATHTQVILQQEDDPNRTGPQNGNGHKPSMKQSEE